MLETKRNYHPLIIILFASGMLSLEEINQIPDTTKHNTNGLKSILINLTISKTYTKVGLL